MRVLFKVQKTREGATLTEWAWETEVKEREDFGLVADRIFREYAREVGLKEGWLYTVVVDCPQVVLSCQK
jgi:hypothetical protein